MSKQSMINALRRTKSMNTLPTDRLEDSVIITLHFDDVGQILKDLEARRESWEATAEYLETEVCPDCAVEDCNDPEYARNRADWYAQLIEDINAQRMNGR